MNQTESMERLLHLIHASMWGNGGKCADRDTYTEMKKQALILLPARIISALEMPEDLRNIWKADIYQQISYNVNCLHEQASLPVTVPYIILKGIASAQYYPDPKFRVMGDIDIMPRHEDFEKACQMLIDGGYTEIVQHGEYHIGRHRTFQKNGIIIEVHAYYAILNDPESAHFLDELIISNINQSHLLPDLVNGLVLLSHINQHLEEGLGLRQIIDWMMFVNKCLPDEKWEEFSILAEKTGMKKLAIIVTRLCEIYLGLPERKWCAEADEKTCGKLLEYIFACGNFGTKRMYNEFASEKLLTSMRTPKSMFKLLQRHGLHNWKASQNHPFLRPFAWIYQIGHYIRKTLSRKVSIGQLKTEWMTARERNALFDALGVTQKSKGFTTYKNGKYVKE